MAGTSPAMTADMGLDEKVGGPMHVSMTKARATLHELVRRAAEGEDIVITYRGRPSVRLESTKYNAASPQAKS
jgi:prevent-host-death family protein